MNPRMTVWVCPSCAATVHAIAVEVGHRCPCRRQNAWVAWVRQPERELAPWGEYVRQVTVV